MPFLFLFLPIGWFCNFAVPFLFLFLPIGWFFQRGSRRAARRWPLRLSLILSPVSFPLPAPCRPLLLSSSRRACTGRSGPRPSRSRRRQAAAQVFEGMPAPTGVSSAHHSTGPPAGCVGLYPRGAWGRSLRGLLHLPILRPACVRCVRSSRFERNH